MTLTCPQCGHTSAVTCKTGCCELPDTQIAAGALVCTKCSAINRLELDSSGTWIVRVPNLFELDQLLKRPDIMVGIERMRRAREARA